MSCVAPPVPLCSSLCGRPHGGQCRPPANSAESPGETPKCPPQFASLQATHPDMSTYQPCSPEPSSAPGSFCRKEPPGPPTRFLSQYLGGRRVLPEPPTLLTLVSRPSLQSADAGSLRQDTTPPSSTPERPVLSPWTRSPRCCWKDLPEEQIEPHHVAASIRLFETDTPEMGPPAACLGPRTPVLLACPLREHPMPVLRAGHLHTFP